MIVEIASPFEVQSVHGVIKDPAGYPMPDVTFEIRTESGRIREVRPTRWADSRFPEQPRGGIASKLPRTAFNP